MGTLGDLLVLGEGPSIVADADVDLLGRACELLWSRAVAAGRCDVLKSKNQTLIFGPMCIENAKEIPTFRINFSNFPWQLLGACRPAGFTCLKLVAVCSGCAVY